MMTIQHESSSTWKLTFSNYLRGEIKKSLKSSFWSRFFSGEQDNYALVRQFLLQDRRWSNTMCCSRWMTDWVACHPKFHSRNLGVDRKISKSFHCHLQFPPITFAGRWRGYYRSRVQFSQPASHHERTWTWDWDECPLYRVLLGFAAAPV